MGRIKMHRFADRIGPRSKDVINVNISPAETDWPSEQFG